MELNFIVPEITDKENYRKAKEISDALSSDRKLKENLEKCVLKALSSLRFHADKLIGYIIVTSSTQVFSCLAHSDASQQNVSLSWTLPVEDDKWTAFWTKKDGTDVYIGGELQTRGRFQKWER